MENVWKNTTWKCSKFESVAEMLSLIGKKRIFEDWCLQKFPNSHCILIDDSFGDTLFN